MQHLVQLFYKYLLVERRLEGFANKNNDWKMGKWGKERNNWRGMEKNFKNSWQVIWKPWVRIFFRKSEKIGENRRKSEKIGVVQILQNQFFFNPFIFPTWWWKSLIFQNIIFWPDKINYSKNQCFSYDISLQRYGD